MIQTEWKASYRLLRIKRKEAYKEAHPLVDKQDWGGAYIPVPIEYGLQANE